MLFARRECLAVSAVWIVLCADGACADGTSSIDGLAPDRRPADAPAIHGLTKDAAWYSQALRGVEPPFPVSLRFLEDQGAWFTPFSRPGMTGPYDIRRWHVPPVGGAAATR